MKHSGLRLLVDVGVGKKVEKWLQEYGCDVKSIRDINPQMSDKEILKAAVSEKRLVITMDTDLENWFIILGWRMQEFYC